ncbi:uncharacterized protein LOC134077393 [Sardina pilchardus]|uniref:uncharacterized protein LOC134077393 n=1 Tax=Sardina pilchardus TaxID=27697 RepID=UPI002E11F834
MPAISTSSSSSSTTTTTSSSSKESLWLAAIRERERASARAPPSPVAVATTTTSSSSSSSSSFCSFSSSSPALACGAKAQHIAASDVSAADWRSKLQPSSNGPSLNRRLKRPARPVALVFDWLRVQPGALSPLLLSPNECCA